MPQWKKSFLKYVTVFVARMAILFGAGMFRYKQQRPKVNYEKYLGPEWTPSYVSPSTIVCNHSSWVDIGLITIMKFPSFTPKMEIKKWPVIGQICDVVFNSYFINRAGTHEEKH